MFDHIFYYNSEDDFLDELYLGHSMKGHSVLNKTKTRYYNIDRIVPDESRNNNGKNLVRVVSDYYTDYEIVDFHHGFEIEQRLVPHERVNETTFIWNFSSMDWDYFVYDVDTTDSKRVPKSRLKTEQLSKKVMVELLL